MMTSRCNRRDSALRRRGHIRLANAVVSPCDHAPVVFQGYRVKPSRRNSASIRRFLNSNSTCSIKNRRKHSLALSLAPN